MPIDRFGRRIHYLRVSLTDHCNLRCIYCMPEDMSFRPLPELMQDDEIIRLVELFANLGFDRVRLTGGEPILRSGVVEIVRGITNISGIEDVTMTTNGTHLDNLAKPLAEAGLKRVNISIDTLDPVRFQGLTRRGNLNDVWRGIQAAENAGLTPVKLNAVIVRGYNENDILDLARLTIDHPWHLRFIEMMPFGGSTETQTTGLVTTAEIRGALEQNLGPLVPVQDGNLNGEARYFHIPGAKANIGFISSVSAPFCHSCTRVRITADGILRLCLLREFEIDLLTPLRNGASQEDLRKMVVDAIWNKPWGHGLAEGIIPLNRVMNEIGG